MIDDSIERSSSDDHFDVLVVTIRVGYSEVYHCEISGASGEGEDRGSRCHANKSIRWGSPYIHAPDCCDRDADL